MKKKLILISILMFIYLNINAQISTLVPIPTEVEGEGSIIISAKGIQGITNSSSQPSNLAFGSFALVNNSSGIQNTGIGLFANNKNTTGSYNFSNGYYASYGNSTGSNNTAFGYYSLYNYKGSHGIALGASTARTSENYQGSSSAVGAFSLNVSGSTANVGVGAYSINRCLGCGYETAVGAQALYNDASSIYNTAVGFSALYSFNLNNLTNNTASGNNALKTNVSGYNNTAFGHEALRNNIASANTALGTYALQNNTSGSNNVGVGRNVGITVTNGGYLTLLGAYSYTSGNFINATAIGANAVVNHSNKVRIGDGNVTVIEGQVPFSNVSDRRLKENINYTSSLGLAFIKRLRPSSYQFIADKAKTRYDGFIAQDVEAIMKELNVRFSGLKKSNDGTYSLAYSDFVIPLVTAIKEQQIRIESQKQRIERLKKSNELMLKQTAEFNELKVKIDKIIGLEEKVASLTEENKN